MSSKKATGSNHCSLKQFFKTEHREYYKLLKNTFCAGFIFNDARPKTILIPGKQLLEKIKKESESSPKNAFDSIKKLIFDKPYTIDQFKSIKKIDVGNLMNQVVSDPEALIKNLEEVEYSRWVDDDDKYAAKKKEENKKENTKIYLYSGSDVPKSSEKKTGKGINGGSHVKDDESVNVYTILNQWLGNLMASDSKKLQLEAETYAVSVLLFIQDNDKDLFESISKYVISPNPVITLYGCLLLLNTEKLERLKPVVEAFSLKNPGSYAALIKSLKHKKSADHSKIVDKLISESNPYDMYSSLLHYYQKELKGAFESVSTIPEKKHIMFKLMIDELQFNEHKHNKNEVTHELIDDLLCNVKIAYVMQNHSSLYNPLVLKGINYTYGSSDSNKIIKKDVTKYLIEFIKSDYFLYVNDASGIVVGGTHEDKNYNLSMLKDIESRIQKMIKSYDHNEDSEEKKGNGVSLDGGLDGGRHNSRRRESHGSRGRYDSESDSGSESD